MDNTILLTEADVRLTPVGEIRFGPRLYELTIANERIEDSSFFSYYLYSKELDFLIITEYIYSARTEYYTQLMLTDLKNRKRSIYGRIKNGLIKPKKIENGDLILTRESGDGVVKEYEVPLGKIFNGEGV